MKKQTKNEAHASFFVCDMYIGVHSNIILKC